MTYPPIENHEAQATRLAELNTRVPWLWDNLDDPLDYEALVETYGTDDASLIISARSRLRQWCQMSGGYDETAGSLGNSIEY